ncbi:retrotransposon protein, putative, ty1-copia subclass [Tanacetum coccineum]
MNAASGAGGGSGIFVIELNTFLNRSWIYDTGCGTHICNTTQGLRASRKLKPGALSLYVGNGQREAVEAIGNFDLSLPSGLVIVLNNCHYAPSITRGVISVSRLLSLGSISEIDCQILYTKQTKFYYTLATKISQTRLDSALLWHCRLGHISKKRIEKLQHDGLLNSTDLRAFEKAFLLRTMTMRFGKWMSKPAFLRWISNEEVYMEQPKGFVNPKYSKTDSKLKRSIYGLKQASRQWNKRFDDEIKKFGFSQNADEPCVYLKASGSNVTFLILYVDDILIMGNSIPMLQDVKSYLGKCFAMKDLGEAAYILGIKIYRDRSRRLIGLCQSAYIEKILKRFHMENSKRGSIPMQDKLRLSKSQPQGGLYNLLS